MPLFRYKAMDEKGKKIRGMITADSYALAKELVRKEKILITHLSLVGKKEREVVLEPPFLLAFTREIGQLLRAGMPLYESFLTMEEKYRRHKMRSLLLNLCELLKGGHSLSSALQHYPKSFDPIYIAMVQSAEQTGSLPSVFLQLTDLLSRQQKLKKQMGSSLAYPLFLASFCFVVIFALLFFIIPSLQELFEGRALHPLTQTVLTVSQFLRAHLNSFAFGVCFVFFSFFLLLRHKKSSFWIHNFALKIPLVKTLILQSALIRFSRTVSLLLQGGVPLVEALRLSQKVIKHVLLEAVIQNVQKKVIEGESLSSTFKSSSLIPPLLVRMLSIGEETGKMADMLQNVADIYDEELQRSLTQFTALLQPAMLLFMGAVIGVVILSVLIPLTDVSSFLEH